ncbi:MAG: hypothetical protein PHN52_13250 [candidate division Zixibacteria bacterium]|nr:hypothetical protein [candidate division Zixibacteria bacterium]
MSQKLNCWQFKNCGREKGGLLADVLGVCPVATAMKQDGTNGGIAAGRVCWQVCDSAYRNDPAVFSRKKACYNCEFYRRVLYEEEEKTCYKFTSIEKKTLKEEKI